MADRIQFRRDTAARWAQYNPVLLEGEVGYVTDNPNQYKIGDGIHAWNSLPFRGFDGTVVQETGNAEDAVMSQKAVTTELQNLKRESDCGQFGYAKDCFINGSTGSIATFKGLCILTIPYKSGDVVEVVGATDPDGPTGGNHSYNFYAGDEYLGGAETLDDIPEGTNTIKVNGNYSSGNGIQCVTINGKAYNIRSMVYLLDKEVASNAEAIAQNAEAIAQNAEAIADDSYPTFNTWTAYPKGYAVLYSGTVYRFTADHAAGGWTGDDAEAYPLAERWRDYNENDYYHPLTFVGKDSGNLTHFRNIAYIEFPYKEGDTVEIFQATTSGAYNRYNFFKDGEFLGSANDAPWSVDLIPEGCDRIKVNGSLANPPIVIVNGVGINRASEAYRVDREVSANAEAIAQNAEAIAQNAEAIADTDRKLDDINKQLYTEYTSLITDYGTNTCIQNWSGYVTISYENGKYKVVVTNNTGGTFIAKSTNIDESLLTAGRRIAYFVDVEFVKFPAEQATWSFGAINDVGRKTVNAAQGQRMRSVFKAELTEETAVANKCGLFLVLAFSAALNEDWEYLYHAFGIIDCGTDNSNPLYNLGEDEILALLAEGTYAEGSKIAAPKVLEVEGLKNANGTFTFRDKEDNTLAVLDGTGLRVKDVKSLESKDLFLRRKLQGKEFFTVGDSLCSAGSWQPMFAELTGGVFDKAYNKDNISIGGTTSLGASAYSGQNRLKKLIEEKSPEIIILENINDFRTDVGDSDYSYMIGETSVSETTYETASEARAARATEVSLIPTESRSIGHALRIGYKSEQGKKLTISGTATANKTATVRVGTTSASINIESGDTAADVIAKIYEVYWAGYDKFTDNATYVAFVNTDGGAADVGMFRLSGEGITVEEGTYASTSYVNYYYKGQATDDEAFSNSSNWTESVPISAVYKGMFEYIYTKLPNCRVIWFIPTRMLIQWTEGGNGWDENLWLEKGVRVNMNYYKNTYANKVNYDIFRKFQREVAELYGAEVYDINEECGITPYNHKTFYLSYNVHPLQAGYDRWADTLARMLKA